MSEEDLANNKTYISDFDITKHIVLDNESNYWYSAEYVDKMLKKQDKEIERLKEELKKLNEIIEIGRKREYHSKFLKDFQKERGKNVFPDHDEIYKRYDDYKSRVEKAIDLYENDDYSTLADDMYKILKGVDKE